MSKYIPGNQKHLSLEDRKYIERSLNAACSFKDIARFLCVNGIIKIPTFGGENSPLCYASFKPFVILKA